MNLDIEDKVALVCGSTSGLGLAIAQTLARERCKVVLNGRDETRLARAVEQVSANAAAEVVGFSADVSVVDEAVALVDRTVHELGSIDILLCNAGGPAATVFTDTDPDAWQAAIDLNLLSTISLCRAAVPHMLANEWGRIVCLTSVAAKEPLPGLILSTTARAGVLGFAKSLADELATSHVTVNVVCPGYMQTERVDDLVRERAVRENRDGHEIEKELVARIPMRRMGRPEELAHAVAFLSSEHAGYITGVALQVDGGYIRGIL